MTIHLSLSEEQVAIQAAVRRFTGRRFAAGNAKREFSRELWSELAQLGVLGLNPSKGNAQNLAAAVEELGRAGFPGPLAASQLAIALLPEEEALSVATGEKLVSIGEYGLMAWAPAADFFFSMEGEKLARVEALDIEPFETLSGEPWGRVKIGERIAVAQPEAGLAAFNLTAAAYLVGAGLALVEIASAHARQRRQFGRTLGEFQAIAFPLARIWSDLVAAQYLVRLAAYKMDAASAEGRDLAKAARLAASQAARRAAFASHQTLGASGVLENGPLSHLTRQVQQLALTPPTDSRLLADITPDFVSRTDPLPQTGNDDATGTASGVRLTYSAQEEKFRSDVREFLRPYVGVYHFHHHDDAALRPFFQELGKRNWLALSWPKAFGGEGLPITFEYILWDEMAYYRVSRPPLGAGIVAKAIMRYGTTEQHKRWLDPLRRGDIHFALGYSEPEAGSDLASVSCRAEQRGNTYVINGSKCWNTAAHTADYIWLLCRTGEPGSRGRGLSLVIVPRQSKGLTIEPLDVMGGHVFTTMNFDSVEVPVSSRIGPEDGAWAIMGSSLADERIVQSAPKRVRRDLDEIAEFVRDNGLTDNEPVRRRLGELTLDVMKSQAHAWGVLSAALEAQNGMIEAASNKLAYTHATQGIARAAMEFGHPAALERGGYPEAQWQASMTDSIGGGTTEIMTSIIARRVLGLG